MILFSRLICRMDRSASQPISKRRADPRHHRLMDLHSLFSRRSAYFVVVVSIDPWFGRTKRENHTCFKLQSYEACWRVLERVSSLWLDWTNKSEYHDRWEKLWLILIEANERDVSSKTSLCSVSLIFAMSLTVEKEREKESNERAHSDFSYLKKTFLTEQSSRR